mmetsp:Transcript_37649/g.69549  ORF Transcript_37649/g.69549 Transcript_37649/m.69549 type:complete len:504 (-) Transcript_37649:63-1574(-)
MSNVEAADTASNGGIGSKVCRGEEFRREPDPVAADNEAPWKGTAALLAALGSEARQRSLSPGRPSRLSSRPPSALASSGFLSSPHRVPSALSSSASSVRQAASRASYESALLGAVRKQIDGLEEKVGLQITKVQTHSERVRLDTLSRLEEKMTASEGLQMKLDKRMAELQGSFKGLSDEMQVQIRRVDTTDERLWDWRNQLEEQLKTRFTHLEQQMQKVFSSTRATCCTVEEAHKKQDQRLSGFERELCERLDAHKEIQDGLLHFHARIEAVEDHQAHATHMMLHQVSSERSAAFPEADDDTQAKLRTLDQRLLDLIVQLDQTREGSSELHSSTMKQGIELKTLRTMVTARDEQIRRLSERTEGNDLEAKIEQVRRALQEDRQQKADQSEKVEVFMRKLEFQEQAFEELRSRHSQILRQQHRVDPVADGTLEECLFRVSQCEEQLASLWEEVSNLHAAARSPLVQEQMGAILMRLQEVLPSIEAQATLTSSSDFGSPRRTQVS